MRNFRKILPEDEEKIIQLYNNRIGINELSKLLNYSRGKIRKLLVAKEIHIKTYKEINKVYSVNDNYFSIINTSRKAYFLGFIIADGCIHRNKLKISLQEEDRHILETFVKDIQYTGVIAKVIKEGNRKIQYQVTITSDKLTQDLIKLGVIPNKTHFTYFPPIPKEFWSHFIRGLFDGDGCLSVFKPKNRPSKTGTFSIVGNIDLIQKVQEILIQECNLSKTGLYNQKNVPDNIVNVIYGGNQQVEKIGNYLYRDYDNLGLTRKRKKFEIIWNQNKNFA